MLNHMRMLLALFALASLAVTACATPRAGATPPPSTPPAVGSRLTPVPTPSPTPVPTEATPPSTSRIVRDTMQSAVLGRSMPITIYLPAGYDSSSQRRYPVHYLLHGLAGTNHEWEDYGAFMAADAVFGAPEVTPFIIVLPQGDLSYWVDQSGGPSWGAYVAHDLVTYIDTHYRTEAAPTARALGGLSAGADGALQISLNYPGIFTIVAAHSPVLRPYAIAAPFYGTPEYHAAHYPPTLFQTQVEAARQLRLWLDVGANDEWRPNVDALHEELTQLGIVHTRDVWPGVHEPAYWSAHLPEYLRWVADQFAATR